MTRKPLLALALLAVASIAFADEKAIEEAIRLEKQVRDTSSKVVPAFVFIGGGSGVLISSDGWFLTNHHVCLNPEQKRDGEGKPMFDGRGNPVVIQVFTPDWPVTLPGGKVFKAEIVGMDPIGDICLGKIKNARDLPFVDMGDSDALKPGEAVIAVGNPFMLGTVDFRPTVSLGLVSALHRYQGGYSDAIQTDAAVNPGNSGGPLFTIDGRLIGINGRINPRFGNRVNTGVGYAIPVNQVKNFLRSLKKGGYVPHARIQGLQTPNINMPGALNTEGNGARVFGVSKGSNAEAIGFQKDDLIVEFAGQKIHNEARYLGVLGTYPGGASVTIKVKRGDEVVELKAKLDKMSTTGYRKADIGATLKDADGGGVEVTKVKGKTDAEKKLLEGDVILKFNNRAVKDEDELRVIMRKLTPRKVVPLVIRRDGKELDLEVILGEQK